MSSSSNGSKLIRRHITDSNSWPLDLASHPELAKYGAYSPAQKYSEADIKQIIIHAGEVSSSPVL
jgi:hypothetical protein